jgi:predicted alpha/beta hydrolase family esterase
MKKAIIVHGKPTKERYENPLEPKPHQANWLPWLGKQLTDRGMKVSIPAMPLPYAPVYKDWKAVFPEGRVGPETGLIGHSAGAEFLLHWLSENRDATAERLVLVAPYRDYTGKYGEFSRYNLDLEIAKRVGNLTIFNSLDDDVNIQTRAQHLAKLLPEANLIELEGFGHFRIGHNMTSQAFPQLLEVVLS